MFISAVRCMCRSCRFTKCLNVGMDRAGTVQFIVVFVRILQKIVSAVQPSRDAIGKQQHNQKRRRRVSSVECESRKQDILADPAQNQPSSKIISPVAQQSPLQSLPYLSGIQIAYQNLLERRRVAHGSETIHDLFANHQTVSWPQGLFENIFGRNADIACT